MSSCARRHTLHAHAHTCTRAHAHGTHMRAPSARTHGHYDGSFVETKQKTQFTEQRARFNSIKTKQSTKIFQRGRRTLPTTMEQSLGQKGLSTRAQPVEFLPSIHPFSLPSVFPGRLRAVRRVAAAPVGGAVDGRSALVVDARHRGCEEGCRARREAAAGVVDVSQRATRGAGKASVDHKRKGSILSCD